MTAAQRAAVRRVARAPYIRNPFVGRRDRWYRVSAADLRVLRALAKEKAHAQTR